MKKIPTVFQRSEDRRHVIPVVTPGCEWVLTGEGVATRKYDGTCVLIRRDGMAVHAFVRREVKPGKEPPANWREVDHDETTGKRVGWEPAEQSSFAKFIAEAITGDEVPGTYELCGPKINGNPEGFDKHVLVQHANADRLPWCSILPGTPPEGAYGVLAALLPEQPIEGVVWHHPDGRMAKLKRRDFPKP